MALVMIVGGIDLSVGSMFALTNFCALYLMHVLKWPVAPAVAVTLICGAALGAVNGVLIGYFRLRAFLTTLITLIIYRALLRPADRRLRDRDRRRPSRFEGLGLHRQRRLARRADGRLRLRRGRDLRPHLPDAAAPGLARHRHRRLAPLGLQHRYRGAPHGGALLRRERRAHGARRHLLRVAPRDGRRRHRRRPRDHRADRGRARRHQPRRRQGLGDEGAGRHADRAADHQRPDHAVAAGRLQPHGARRHPAARRGDRHPLAEEPAPDRQQGLRQPDLPRHAAVALDRAPTAAPPGR